MILVNIEESSNVRKMISFKYFRLWGDSVLGKNCESMLYSYVPNAFCFAFRLRSGCSCAETCEECLNLRMFDSLDTFLQFFGQVKE